MIRKLKIGRQQLVQNEQKQRGKKRQNTLK